MAWRKITIDNSVRYILQSEQTKERATKPNIIKNREQSKNISQNNKKILNNISASGFKFLK